MLANYIYCAKPEIAFTGDTMSDFILDEANIDVLRARILVMEGHFSLAWMNSFPYFHQGGSVSAISVVQGPSDRVLSKHFCFYRTPAIPSLPQFDRCIQEPVHILTYSQMEKNMGLTDAYRNQFTSLHTIVWKKNKETTLLSSGE
ncbi:hypothetical protein AB3S75_036328 [Citrus x aurantiifolia]